MEKYSVIVNFSKVDKIENFDIGNKITFNIQDGIKKYISNIEKVEIYKSNKLKVYCLLDEKIYNDFQSCNYNLDWCDFDLEKCIINGKNLIDDYLC